MIDRPFDPVAHARAMRSGGYWRDATFDEFLTRTIASAPGKVAIVADRADRAEAQRFTYAELGNLVARAAAALRRMDVKPGDVVAVQLPNWWEFVVASLAVNRIGAVVNPLMPIFRERELGYMLEFAEARALIVPKVYRGFDYEAMAMAMRPRLPDLKHVIVVGGDGANAFDTMILGSNERVEAPAAGESPALRPDELAVLMFTSGTTGSPKGVMHTTNTLVACSYALAERFGLTADDVLMGSTPFGHMTGYAAVMMLSLRLGATLILQDIWEARRGLMIMAREGATYAAASTPFLADIADGVAAGGPRPEKLRSFLCGGAPIPSSLIERAARELGLQACSLWGMTECLAGTLTEPHRAAEKSSKTDGRSLDGVGVKIVDFDNKPAKVGLAGKLLVSGAQMFIGYFKRPDLETFDADGWFDTGDLAYMDDDEYIRITGRTKDVIIRGGENVPVVEIENLLYKHASVADAALVGYPDERLGERGCAFLVLRSGAQLDLAGVRAYMAECKVARQYWPERVEIVAALPRTPSGKIQKALLRERAKENAGELTERIA